jgi:phenylalanyl-tRNA synthetase alpha chain
MEIYSWHSGLKKWVEIGNSGLFRPEMLGKSSFRFIFFGEKVS